MIHLTLSTSILSHRGKPYLAGWEDKRVSFERGSEGGLDVAVLPLLIIFIRMRSSSAAYFSTRQTGVSD